MNANDFVTPNHIIAEVTHSVDDENLRSGFSKGWFMSRVQDAVQELAFDTFFQKITADFDFPKDSLAIEMPKNAFNIREIYLFNSDCCSPATSQPVHWKRLYNNRGKGQDYTSRVKEPGKTAGTDPYIPTNWRHNGHMMPWLGTLYFANIQDGMIMFGSDCASFSKVRLVYNGMGGEIGEVPIIPRFLERAVNDYVEERYWNAMKARDIRYRTLWSDAYQRLNDRINGSWKKAEKRIASMDSWQKESLNEYMTGIYHK